MKKSDKNEYKITDVIRDREILSDFLNLTYKEFTAFYPDIPTYVYFNTVTRLLDLLNQQFIKDYKHIADIDGTWILDRCLYNGIDPKHLFIICS